MYYHEQEFDPPVRRRILEEVCRRMGLTIDVLQPREGGYFLRISNGSKFINHQTNHCAVNSYAATEVAKDKTHTYLILNRAKVRIPRGDYYFRSGFFKNPDFSVGKGTKEALRDGLTLGMNWTREQSEEYLANGRKNALTFKTPLIVKPNSLSGGKGVSRVDLSSELEPAINNIFGLTTDIQYIAIVQEYIAGKEYRLGAS